MVKEPQGGEFPAEGCAVAHEGRVVWAVAVPCGVVALLTPFPVVPWRDMPTLHEVSLGWVCTWHKHPAGMDPQSWQARAVVPYPSWSLPTAGVTSTQWWDRALSCPRDGGAVAACPNLPRESVTAQPWTVSLHLPTVAARLAVVNPEVLPLEDGPGFRLARGMEVRFVYLANPVAWSILERLHFARGDRADVWAAVHCHLPDAWNTSPRPACDDQLVGM